MTDGQAVEAAPLKRSLEDSETERAKRFLPRML